MSRCLLLLLLQDELTPVSLICFFNWIIYASYDQLIYTSCFKGSSFFIAAYNQRTFCWQSLLSCLRTEAFTLVILSSVSSLFASFATSECKSSLSLKSYCRSESSFLIYCLTEFVCVSLYFWLMIRSLATVLSVFVGETDQLPVSSTFCLTI